MKKIYLLLSLCICTAFGFHFNAFSQKQIPGLDPSTGDYWQYRIADKNENYFGLVEEFNNYWKNKDKTNVKGTGYKQFKRWQYAMEGMAGPDGKLLPASYFEAEVKKFNQLYGGDNIVGNWEFIGPEKNPLHPPTGFKTGIGRLVCFAFHPTSANTIYAGAPAGGIWKTTTGGNNWANLNTDDIESIGVSSILVHPDNPQIIFIGTGDKDGYDVPGNGIWKTTDGGNIWNLISSSMDNYTVTEILMSPANHNYILAATNYGVYRSADGGSTWAHSSGIWVNVRDMAFKPGDPSIVYATGEGKFYRSTNNGTSWTQITSGLETANRCIIGVSPADPGKVYFFATKDSKFSGLFISTDSGQSFPTKKTSSVFDNSGQGWYNIAFAADPTNADIIFAGMVSVYKSTNGGNTWSELPIAYNIHADQHDFQFSPHNNDLYVGNDGGLYVSDDLGNSFTDLSDGLEITMACRIAVSETDPDIFLAGLQDNGTITPYGNDYYRILGGDGMHCAIDYTNALYMYGSAQHTDVIRSAEGGQYTQEWSSISSSITEEAGWFRPFILDKNNPNRMYAGYQNVWRSSNVKAANPGDVTWTNISSGKLNDDGVIEVIEQSMADENVIYISKGDGSHVYRCDQATSTNPGWTEITRPSGGNIKCLETHPTNANIVYIVLDDNIYKSTNKGMNWTPIKDNLPNIPYKCMVYHIGSNEGLYVGTLAGVYFRDATMSQWELFKTGLPLVPVIDLKIIYSTNPDQLVAGTWGRGLWKTTITDEYKCNLVCFDIASTANLTRITMNVGVSNYDDMNTSAPCMLGYYLSSNSNINVSDYLIGTDPIGTLAPHLITGQSIQMDVEYGTNPPPPGTYYMGAFVDKDLEVDETNETDNAILASSQVTIAQPGIPVNVAAGDGEWGNKIEISWDEPAGDPDTLYYRVFRNTVNNSSTAQMLGIVWNTTQAYTDYTATDGIDHYYWVKAAHNYLGVNSGGFSGANTGWQYLDPPDDVEATDGMYNNRIRITWTKPEGATHFKIWKNTTANFNTAVPLSSGWVASEYFEDYQVTSGQYYYYWVKSARSSTGFRASPNYSNNAMGYASFLNTPTVTASNGTSTTHIDISWTTIPGASHYKVFHNDVNDPETSSAVTAWITGTSTTHSPPAGVYWYYWVKAAVSVTGQMETGYSEPDSGWRKLEAVQNVQATDGTSPDYIRITWNNQINADNYRVYRSTTINSFTAAYPVSNWIQELTYDDITAPIPQDCWYWVLCSNNTSLQSEVSSSNIGWRKLQTPVVTATDGVYLNRVQVTWNSIQGAGSYRLFRGPGYGVFITDTLTDWSSTLNFSYSDYSAVQGENYYYFVMAALNNYGYKAGDAGYDHGMADECCNLTEYGNTSLRSVDIRGTDLTLTHPVLNNGPHPSQPGVQIVYYLTSGPPTWNILYNLGSRTIPSIQNNDWEIITYNVDLAAITGGPVVNGNYYLTYLIDGSAVGCESNLNDNVIHWEDPVIDYTDRLFGAYTVGGTSPDFANLTEVQYALMNRDISDHVIFNIRPGLYSEQIILNNSIEGIGETRTILFRTEPSATDTAEVNFADYEVNGVFLFDNISYITLERLKLVNPGYSDYQSTYGGVISLKNNPHHITVKNCLIRGTTDLSYINDDAALVYSDGSKCDYLTLQDNKLVSGSYGIYLDGSASQVSLNNQITDNTITGFMYQGIYMRYRDNPIILRNNIKYGTSWASQLYGINLENTSNGLRVEQNRVIIENPTSVAFGIALSYCNANSTVRGKIANNFICIESTGTSVIGLSHFITEKTDVFYNSINIFGTPALQSQAINFDSEPESTATWDVKVKNNIFLNNAGGYSIGIGDNAVNQNYVSQSDYNDLLSSGSYIAFYNWGNNISNMSSWRAATPYGDHSVSVNPSFTTNTDLHLSGLAVDGLATPITEVFTDIDGEGRDNLHPDLGADEYIVPPPAYDVALLDITAPISGYGLSHEESISIELENPGAEGLGSVPVSYTINGGLPVNEICQDTLIPGGGTASYTFATKADLSGTGAYYIKAYSSLPEDEIHTNDTLMVIIENHAPVNCPPLYGIGCEEGAYINNFYLNDLVHINSYCSYYAGYYGYGIFTDMTANITQGEFYWYGISVEADGMHAALWIDFDDDGIYSGDERIIDDLFCEWPGIEYWDTLHFAPGVLPGEHTMRVRLAPTGVNIQPCKYYETGEGHDYTVNIISGGGLSANAGVDVEACLGETLTLMASASGGTPPYTYEWNNGMTGNVIHINADSASLYKVLVTDQSGYKAADAVEVFIRMAPEVFPSLQELVCEGNDIYLLGDGYAYGTCPAQCTVGCDMPTGYCISSAINIENSIIENVTFNTINNNTAGNCATYSDFTGISTQVVRGQPYQISITAGTCGTDEFKSGRVWIDYNRDGNFDEWDEEFFAFGPNDTTFTYTMELWTSDTAHLGTTRMRVIVAETWDPWLIQPCGNYSYGETEDYSIEIVSMTDNYIDAWYWTGPDGFVSELQNPVIPDAGLENEGFYILEVTDGNGCTNSDPSLYVQLGLLAEVYAGTDTSVCDGSPVYLNGSVENGSNINWTSTGSGYFEDDFSPVSIYYPDWDDIQNGSVVLTLYATSQWPCTDIDSSFITVTFLPSPYIEIPLSDITCGFSGYPIIGTVIQNYSSLLWTTQGDGLFSDPSITEPVYYPGQEDVASGSVILTLTANAISPCIQGSVSYFELMIEAPPEVYAGENATVEQGESYFLDEATANNFTSVEWQTSGNGYFDDPYFLNPVYYPDAEETGTTLLVLNAYGFEPCGEQTDTMELQIQPYGGFDLELTVMLQGPFEGAVMRADLNEILPLNQPYHTAPWYYSGSESTSLIPNTDIVDWILIELRDAPDAASASPATIIAQQAGFLLNNGSVVGMDGFSNLHFDNQIDQYLFVVIRHRNHLGIMSAYPLSEFDGLFFYDFTMAMQMAYLDGQIILNDSVYGMFSGDADADGSIGSSDKSIWTTQAGTTGYQSGDFDLDGQADNEDKNDFWKPNIGEGSQVPD